MKRLLAVLCLLWSNCYAEDRVFLPNTVPKFEATIKPDHGPVLQLRICKQGICPKGIPCTPTVEFVGSCVVVASKEVSTGTEYGLLTAAHVITQSPASQDPKVAPDGWKMYPADHFIEVYAYGRWRAASFKYVAHDADIGMITMRCSQPLQMVCVAAEHPQKGATIHYAGYAETETSLEGRAPERYTGKVQAIDSGRCGLDMAVTDGTPVRGGQSGGAVLDENGDLVGIIVGYVELSNLASMYTNHREVKKFVEAAWHD